MGNKIIACILCLFINWIVSFLLYEPVMEVFEISTDGFMNLNGLITATVIWMLIAITILMISYYAKEPLGYLYRTVRTVQLVFLLLPIILLFVFLFAVSLK